MKRYLGDGVYAQYDEYGTIILTTEDGIETTNTIYLEPEVLVELERLIHVAQTDPKQRPMRKRGPGTRRGR